MNGVMKKLTDLTPTLRIAERENFHLIPIRKQEKRPLWKKWQQRRLSPQGAKSLLSKGFNVGVVAENLWIVDYDNHVHDIDFLRHWNTLIALTPNGHHIYFKGKNPSELCRGWNTIRHGRMFALLPPSQVLVKQDGFQVLKKYWWLDYGRTTIRTLD